MILARKTFKATLYIPSNVCGRTDTPFMNEMVNNVSTQITDKYGGCAYYFTNGMYKEDSGNTVVEHVTKIDVWFDTNLTKDWLFFKGLAEFVCREMRQECVLLEYDNVAYFVDGKEGV